MRFAIGYQPEPQGGASFAEMVREYRDDVGEVYFASPGAASGRPAMGVVKGNLDPQKAERFVADLKALAAMDVALDVLFNANCYGGGAMGEELRRMVDGELQRMTRVAAAPRIITTTSPAVAHVVRSLAPDIEIRASVNMRLGSPEAMTPLLGLFDSFYIQRDVQRNLEQLRRLSAWARENGKKIGLLANSGCLAFCPAQTFHDNLMAHAQELSDEPLKDFEPYICRSHLAASAHRVAALQATWIRPEDLHHYVPEVDFVKLATRTHPNPRMVLEAYARERFAGNLLELLEPGHADLFLPNMLENAAFPADWFKQTSTCSRQCHQCDYCMSVMKKILCPHHGYDAAHGVQNGL